MPHLDEGTLHAWLDGGLSPSEGAGADAGAHLEACPDCRARLDEARRLRERAGEILSVSAPAGITAPPFEALRARGAGRGTSAGDVLGRPSAPGRGRAAFWRDPRRLAWAASLVLAVGAGWMGRQLTYGPASAPAGRATEGALQELPASLSSEPEAAPERPVEAAEPSADAEAAPSPTAAAQRPAPPPATPVQEAVAAAGKRAPARAELEDRRLDVVKPEDVEGDEPAIGAAREEPRLKAEVRGQPRAPAADAQQNRDAKDAFALERAAEVRRSSRFLGCWRLRYAWPAGLELPESLELRSEPDAEEPDGMLQAAAPEAPATLIRFRWRPLGPDSLEVEGTGSWTLRLRLTGDEETLQGSGRVWTAEGGDAGGALVATRGPCPE